MSRASVDLLVIGAGLIGAAATWHGARAGAAVLLVDAGHPNSGASGQNAGSLHFQIERRFLEHGDRQADEAARITALSRIAIDDWAGLEAALATDLHVRQDGGVMVAETAAEVTLLEAKTRREQAAGLRTRLIDAAEARRIAPYLSGAVVAASFLADEGHADPRRVTPAFIRAAEAAGAELRSGTRVVALTARRPGFDATLLDAGTERTVRADRVLIAAGAWSARLAALTNIHLPIFPVALMMNVTERIAPFMPHLVQHVGRRLSMKQTSAGNVLIGGGWPARMRRDATGAFDPGRTPKPISASLTGNLRAAVATVPAVADLNLLRSWTGTTAVTADQLPIVGEIPRLPGLFVAAGGSAFTLGPTFARLVTRALLQDDADAEAALSVVSPARFEHLNGFMG